MARTQAEWCRAGGLALQARIRAGELQHPAVAFWDRVRMGEIPPPEKKRAMRPEHVPSGYAPLCENCQRADRWAVFCEGGLWYCAWCIDDARYRALTENRVSRRAAS